MRKEEQLLAYLKGACPGRQHAAPGRRLRDILGVSESRLHEMVNHLRQEGYPIGSGRDGYFYIRTFGEARETEEHLARMIRGLEAARQGLLGHFEEPVPYTPRPVYVRPTAEAVKSRSLSGSAFIDFPVNKTVIYPDYRRNTAELGKIEATIDSVRNDRDVTITSVWLKGYASPESPWTHNRMLAIGRTEALKKHIGQLYRFDEGVIETDYEPEDWAGLRSYVERSNLTHRAEILALIDSSLEPDAKEAKIKRSYPEEYDFLLKNCYPALRHTDYRITYTIRTFSDAQEIRRIMLTQPQKLSLNEFYLAAQACSPGSDEFNEIFETAVRMYPEDTAANLNAANTAMQKGDLKNAEHYLRKAGESPEALYARGAYAMLTEEYETAAGYLREAEKAGIREAGEALEQLQKQNKK